MAPRRRRPRGSGGARRRSRAGERKALQLCAQVRRALELALVGECADEVLQDLQVESVEPAPDEARLCVVLSVHGPGVAMGRAEVRARLEQARGLLLDAVAQTISRRKVPELAFELVGAREPPADGGPGVH